jgi:uncharacterized protein YuzE
VSSGLLRFARNDAPKRRDYPVISRIKEYTYDQEADAIYITFSDKPVASTSAMDDMRVIDYTDDGSPVGKEQFANLG